VSALAGIESAAAYGAHGRAVGVAVAFFGCCGFALAGAISGRMSAGEGTAAADADMGEAGSGLKAVQPVTLMII